MKNFRLLLLIIGIFLISACSSKIEPLPETDLVVIASQRNNSALPAFDMLEDKLFNATFSCGSVTSITVESTPQVIFCEDVPYIDPQQHREQARIETAEKQATILLNALKQKAISTTSDTNILKALHLASEHFSANENNQKELVIMDSGLEIANELNFSSSNLLGSSPESIVNELIKIDAIPNLKNVVITWYQLADTMYPQNELNYSDKIALQQIWLSILEEAGATVVFDNTLTVTTENAESTNNLPPVTLVPILIREIPSGIFGVSEVIALDESKISFIPDSIELLDEQQAKEALSPIIEYLLLNTNDQILLAGSTATVGSYEDCVEFSHTRANVIKKLLVEQGVREEQLITLGLGYNHEFSVIDIVDNQLIEPQATQNRAVFILKSSSEMGQQLITKYS